MIDRKIAYKFIADTIKNIGIIRKQSLPMVSVMSFLSASGVNDKMCNFQPRLCSFFSHKKLIDPAYLISGLVFYSIETRKALDCQRISSL